MTSLWNIPCMESLRQHCILSSRRELNDFLEKLATGAEPLYSITGGVHLHTIEVPSREVLECIENDLRAAGILID